MSAGARQHTCFDSISGATVGTSLSRAGLSRWLSHWPARLPFTLAIMLAGGVGGFGIHDGFDNNNSDFYD
jgi:hypothetical protein